MAGVIKTNEDAQEKRMYMEPVYEHFDLIPSCLRFICGKVEFSPCGKKSNSQASEHFLFTN